MNRTLTRFAALFAAPLLLLGLTGCPGELPCGSVTASIDGCNSFSWQIACEDLNGAQSDDEVELNDFNEEIRRFGTLTTTSGNVYDFDIIFERDPVDGCLTAMDLLVSGGILGSSEENVIVGEFRPQGDAFYNEGFDDGFALDEEYFAGYDDSWETVGFEPVLWEGHLIPFVNDNSYEAGYYDGVFQAYNDGYFVAYRFAFIIGFSEGYAAAYAPDYLQFLASDIHTEYANGGFDDGYNDGYSEGRIFGGVDFELGIGPDWLDGFLDWESGTDLYFEEIDLGTGEFGPVILYEYGVDPLARKNRGRTVMHERSAIRTNGEKQALDFARSFRESDRIRLGVDPDVDRRNGRVLDLETTWLDRIEAVLNSDGGAKRATADRSPHAR